MDVENGPPRFESMFSKWPRRSKIIQRSGYFKNALWPPNLVGRIHDQSVMHWWSQKSCRGQLGSTWGQIAQECPMTAKFGRKNPSTKCSAMMGSKVMQGSVGSTWGQITQEFSTCMSTKFGWKNPWPKCSAIIGAKVMQGSPGQTGVKFLRNALWLPNLVGRTLDRSVMHCWGQRSCWGQPGQPRVKLLRNAPWPPNLVGKTSDWSVTH